MKAYLKKKLKAFNVFTVIALLILTVYSISIVFPLFWAFINSFKSRFDYLYNPLKWPQKFLMGNYLNAFSELKVKVSYSKGIREVFLAEMFFYSIIYAVGFGLTEQISNAFCAYVCAKFSKRHTLPKVVYSIVLIKMVLPIVGNLGSTILVFRAIGIYDNMPFYWLTTISFGGTGFLIYYATFKSISWEYAEAAFIDGASQFRVLTTIMFPQALSVFFALMILEVITRWNDYTTIMLYLQSTPTVAYGLFKYQFGNANASSSVPIQLAGCSLVILPMLIMFIAFNKQIINKVAIGGIKG